MRYPLAVLLALGLVICAAHGLAAQEATPKDKAAAAKPKPTPNSSPAKASPNKIPTGEDVAESVIYIFGNTGGRAALNQIRRNGVERGRISRVAAEGRMEEATYEYRFVRGEDATKDKIRVDQKMPTMEYSLVYGDGRLWGIINGVNFTPRQDAAASFLSQQRHSIDALLRYKENGSTVSYVDKIKQKGLELYVVDLTDKEKNTTRYYISSKSLHVLWLEYQEPSNSVKHTQKVPRLSPLGTLLPYRSVLLATIANCRDARLIGYLASS